MDCYVTVLTQCIPSCHSHSLIITPVVLFQSIFSSLCTVSGTYYSMFFREKTSSPGRGLLQENRNKLSLEIPSKSLGLYDPWALTTSSFPGKKQNVYMGLINPDLAFLPPPPWLYNHHYKILCFPHIHLPFSGVVVRVCHTFNILLEYMHTWTSMMKCVTKTCWSQNGMRPKEEGMGRWMWHGFSLALKSLSKGC